MQEGREKDAQAPKKEIVQQEIQRSELVFIQAQMEMMHAIEEMRTQMEEMDTAPNHVTVAAPKKIKRNPPTMEATKQMNEWTRPTQTMGRNNYSNQ